MRWVVVALLAVAAGSGSGCDRAAPSPPAPEKPDAPLTSWPRPQYRPGGGDAFVAFAVYGRFSSDLIVSRSRHRSNGAPAGLTATTVARPQNPAIFEAFEGGYLAKSLAAGPRELAAAIRSAPQLMMFRGTVKDPGSLDYLRDTVGMVTAALDGGGVGVLDPQTFTWWSPSDWRAQVFDPRGPVPHRQVAILVSEGKGDPPGTQWVHTRGLRKFGRPDLSLRGVKPEQLDAVFELFNRFIELQALGGIIAEGQAIEVRTLPPGMTCHHQGNLEDPDFDNVHVEVRWPR